MSDIRKFISDSITQSFKNLLENHHLYQSYRIDWIREKAWEIIAGIDTELRNTQAKVIASQSLSQPWEIARTGYTVANNVAITIELPTVKLFCKICDRVEAFNPLTGFDLFSSHSLSGINVNAVRENP